MRKLIIAIVATLVLIGAFFGLLNWLGETGAVILMLIIGAMWIAKHIAQAYDWRE